ncbi:MAG: hypothetical protein LC115_04610 [Bacteroidia bacterium]|nr:hypothetical protein [Bacteroidia bacterium]
MKSFFGSLMIIGVLALASCNKPAENTENTSTPAATEQPATPAADSSAAPASATTTTTPAEQPAK